MREELRRVFLNILEVDSISESDSIKTIKDWGFASLELNSVQAIAEAVNRRTEAAATPNLSELDSRNRTRAIPWGRPSARPSACGPLDSPDLNPLS